MNVLIGSIVKIALQVLAGLGIGKILDKVAADKVPGYVPVTEGLLPGLNFKPIKLLFTLVALVAGAMILIFIGKRLRIKILR